MHLTGSLLTRYPQITNRLGYLLSADRHTTRLVISLAHNPYDNSSLDTFRSLNGIVAGTLDGGPLAGARVYVAGPSAFYADIRTTQDHDFRSIVAILLAGIFLVLALLLRSLLAPLYLLATVLLSFAATLGITVALFQGLLGNAGLSFYLPPLLFVVLVALGADYNIFIVGPAAVRLTYLKQQQGGIAFEGNVTPAADFIRWLATTGSSWTQDFTIGNTHGHRTSKITGTRTITVSGKAYRCTVVESTTDFTGSAQGHETDTSCWSAELGMTLSDQRHQTGTYNAVPFDITSTATVRSGSS
jgi:hypothetical protein